jgi:hypothetical protein
MKPTWFLIAIFNVCRCSVCEDNIQSVIVKIWMCSETVLIGNPSSIVWVATPGREPLPPMTGSNRLVHWTSETWWKCEKCRSSTGLPLSNMYGPYRILVVCCHNLWPAVRTELGQEEWLSSLRKPQVKRTYRSRWSGITSQYHCSQTALTSNPSSKVLVAHPGSKPLPPVAGSERLVHRQVRHGESVINEGAPQMKYNTVCACTRYLDSWYCSS